jgi:hypothetical protein
VLEFNLQGIVLRWTNQDCFSAFWFLEAAQGKKVPGRV